MSLNRIIWITGLYHDILNGEKYYGGLTRSTCFIQLLKKNLNIEKIYKIVYKKPLKKQINNDNTIVVRMHPVSIAGRAIINIVSRIGIVNKSRSSIPYIITRTIKGDLKYLSEIITDNDLIVIDGLPGYIMSRDIISKIKSKAAFTIYLSHNYEADFRMGLINWIRKIDNEACSVADLIAVSSHRDAVRYEIDNNIKNKLVVVPNIFPPPTFKALPKSDIPAVAVVGYPQSRTVKEAIKLASMGIVKKIYYVGPNLPKTPRHIEVIWKKNIKDRAKFLEFLSQAHFGINYGEWLGGSNIKKYDYALAGLAVFSGGTGYRDILLPGEIAYTDIYDLIAKIRLNSMQKLSVLGYMNRKTVEFLFNKQIKIFLNKLNDII